MYIYGKNVAKEKLSTNDKITKAYISKKFKDQNIKPEWLYNFGVGIRYEFKHNVNARIDWGFGEGTNGIVFAIGEAF